MIIDAFFISLTLWFIMLKLFGFISWSWFWVFSPLYVLAAIIVLVVGVAWIFPDYFEALRNVERMRK